MLKSSEEALLKIPILKYDGRQTAALGAQKGYLVGNPFGHRGRHIRFTTRKRIGKHIGLRIGKHIGLRIGKQIGLRIGKTFISITTISN